jgi:hypothetical protein
MVMPGREYEAFSSDGYKYSINGQEKEKDINKNITTALYWEYDSRIGRRWNIDPSPKAYESVYLVFAGNPIWFSDIFGADTSKLTGNKNLIIFIENEKGKPDYKRMVKDAKDWDLISVKNFKDAVTILKAKYGDKINFIDNLLIRGHGNPKAGPRLSTDGSYRGMNPGSDENFKYLRGTLTNTANIAYSSCSIVQYFNKKGHDYYITAKLTADNLSSFFLTNTKRNLFLNFTESVSTNTYEDDSYSINFNDDFVTPGEDERTHQKKALWAGFVWFYYGEKSKSVLYQPNFYQLRILSGVHTSFFNINGQIKVKSLDIAIENAKGNDDAPKTSGVK